MDHDRHCNSDQIQIVLKNMNFSFESFKKSKLFKSTLVFTLANVIDKGLPFLILPVLTHAMPPEDFALVALFTGIAALTNYTVGLSSGGYLGVAFFKKNSSEFSQAVFNSVLVFLASLGANVLLIVLFPQFFAEKSGLATKYLVLGLLSSLGVGLQSIILSIYRSQLQAIPYGIFQILRSAIDIGLSLFLVLSLQMSWMGRIWGISAANLILGVCAFYLICRKNLIEFKMNSSLIKEILYFGIPLFPHAIANWALSMADRFFINHYVGPSENGKYALGYTLGMALAVLTQSFNQAWAPYVFGLLKDNNGPAKRNAVRMTYIYFVTIVFIALAFSTVARFVLQNFFPPTYSDAAYYILPVSMSYAFDGMYMMVTNYILYSGKTYLLSVATGSVAVIKLILSSYLIAHYGAQGAIYSALISFFLLFLFTFIMAIKAEPTMPWNLFRSEPSP